MFIYGFMVCAIIMIIMNLFLTKAKYQVTESIPLANGTINYNSYDFKIMAMYTLDSNGKETPINKMPESGYIINEEKSYCTLNNTDPDPSAKLYTNDNGEHIIKGLSKNEKCYLYFDKILTPSEKTLAMLKQYSLGEVGKITGTSCGSNCGMNENGIYKTEDDYGDSYVYRGTVDNNWVKFGTGKGKESGDIWWRIIRINGNGTIRLIYAGTTTGTPNPQGETTMINPTTNAGNNSYPKAVKFNKSTGDNKYVGYMYNDSPATSTQDSAHKVTSKSKTSTILEQIKLWYENDTNLSTLKDKIDVDTGFCSDTNLATGNHGSYTGPGYGQQQSGYAGLDRVWQANKASFNTTEQKPTLKCTTPTRDLYTGPKAQGGTKGSSGVPVTGNNALPVPVGLITMDEVIYAGGFSGKNNTGYWLYTDQYYWTLSPHSYLYGHTTNQYALVSLVAYHGDLVWQDVSYTSFGVRPVINLKADTILTTSGGGTEGSRTNPYIVQTS